MSFRQSVHPALMIFALVIALLSVFTACDDDDDDENNPVNVDQFDFELSSDSLAVDWAISRDQEVACSGDSIAGGATSGQADITPLGTCTIQAYAAWKIDSLIANPVFNPSGPAGGPVATVLGPTQYPYQFHVDLNTLACGTGPSATGEVRITLANGSEVHGRVQGGEAHRLDFLLPGDGVESFVYVRIDGGTGDFENATGSFTMHTIIRFDAGSSGFVVDLAEALPGGTISY
jgi:hypothetical protein